jgi:hypothetical protein
MLAAMAALLLAAPGALAAQAAPPPQGPPGPPPTPCLNDPQRRTFDFWIGTWDVFRWSAPPRQPPQLGVNVITVIESGCALLESWTASGGGTGRSFNWYDKHTQTWRQLWIDQSGGTLDYTRGEFRDGAMRFEGETRGPQGQRVLQRLTFFHIHADTVRQLFESSTDGGATWTPGFDGRYLRRKP